KKGGAFLSAHPVKILGNGDLTKKLIFKIRAVSGSAKEKIQKAGGELAAVTKADESAADSSAK
ncbi:MAG: uL15 family ribosomal protein, partial [Treponema sp.]|nr:uL15 family ribosomal protein [Treponema sp.]